MEKAKLEAKKREEAAKKAAAEAAKKAKPDIPPTEVVDDEVKSEPAPAPKVKEPATVEDKESRDAIKKLIESNKRNNENLKALGTAIQQNSEDLDSALDMLAEVSDRTTKLEIDMGEVKRVLRMGAAPVADVTPTAPVRAAAASTVAPASASVASAAAPSATVAVPAWLIPPGKTFWKFGYAYSYCVYPGAARKYTPNLEEAKDIDGFWDFHKAAYYTDGTYHVLTSAELALLNEERQNRI